MEFSRLPYTDLMRDRFESLEHGLRAQEKPCVPGCVISLDRGFPLVCSPDGQTRAELATTIKKSDENMVAVGDWVCLHRPKDHEKAKVEAVLPRKNEIARMKRVGRDGQVRRQVLAANVDMVLICHSFTGAGIDLGLLIRQMVAVAGCDAEPVFILTKKDMVSEDVREKTRAEIEEVMPDVPLFEVSIEDPASIARLHDAFSLRTTALLLGESGVGKSSLVNALMGEETMRTGSVRESDDKGRHTTVARKMIALPQKGIIIDAPGLRTLQIIDLDQSLKAAFDDIAEAALGCRFRDCTHGDEPGCAVRESVPEKRLAAYRRLLLAKK